ncbi:hypothetical protein KFU94_67490 [Chloroflexi bacterium TSY]|nr:hypothetical protein [Chloroflexi bacterium TSY]
MINLRRFFTFADEEQASEFQQNLLKLIEAPDIYVVITMRSDFYVCLMNSPLWQQISEHRLELLPLKGEGLREAIVNPATSQGVKLEGALVEQLLADAADEPGVLPFIQETMVLLWGKLERRYLPAEAYSSLGDGTHSTVNGLYAAMTLHADHTLASLSSEQRAVAQRILLRLIQFGEGRADTHRQQSVTSLRSYQGKQALFEQTLATLTNGRLLTLSAEFYSGQVSDPLVDIAHGSLINGWPTLRTWIDERRSAELTRRRLEEKATEWVNLNQAGGLLDDLELVEAERWLSGPDAEELGASQDLVDLVTESRDTLNAIIAEKRRSSRIRLTLVTAVVLLVIGALGGGVWFQSQIANQERQAAEEAARLQQEAEEARDQAKISEANALEAMASAERQSSINRAQTIRIQSLLEVDRNAECSLALALEAHDLAKSISDFPHFPFQDSVRNALQATHTEQVLLAHTSLQAVAWSHDGRTIAAGGQEGGTQLWEVTDEELQKTERISTPNSVFSLAFSPDHKLLAIGSIEIVLWDQITKTATGTLTDHSQLSRVLAWHPTGRWLASGSDDGTIVIWDTKTLLAVQRLTEHQQDSGTDDVMGLTWSPDGFWLASTGWDNRIRLWNASDLENDTPDDSPLTLEAARDVNEQGNPTRLAWSPNGMQLAIGYVSGIIQLWPIDAESGFSDDQQPLQSLQAHTGTIWGLAWSSDGSLLVSSSTDQIIRIWDSQSLTPLFALSGHLDAITGGVAWKPDDSFLVSASVDQTVRVWRLAPSVVESHQTEGFLLDAEWKPNEYILALLDATQRGGSIHLWDLESNSTYIIFDSHSASAVRLAWSPDGKQIATASGDTEVHIYDAQSGELLHRLTGHTGPVYDVAWSPDGRQLVSAGSGDSSVFLWDVNDESSERFSGSSPLQSVTWHPRETLFAVGASDGLINLWNVPIGQRYDWSGYGPAVSSVAWHPDGQWLASGGQDGRIIIWDTSEDDLTTGHIWKDKFDLGEQIWDLAWQGNQLAASGVNGSVKVWDVVTGENVANYTGHEGAVRAVDWSHDGRYLATVGMTDGTALVHYAWFEEDLLPIARRQLERGSTEADRVRCLAVIQ